MRILLTGVAGFIGYSYASQISNESISVLGIDNINDYYDVELKLSRLKNLGFNPHECLEYKKKLKSKSYPNIEFVRADLQDLDFLLKLWNQFQPTHVVHLAAQAGVRYSLDHPEKYISSNVSGTLNILEGARKNSIEHLLFASSSSVYGLNTKQPFSVKDPVDHPISLYASTKRSAELIAHSYSHLFKVPCTALRFFTVYGPWGRPDMALFLFAKAILNEKPIDVFNHGNMSRDFTYIDDITTALHKIIQIPPIETNTEYPSTSTAPYHIYNIGNSQPVKLMDFIKEIEFATGKEAILNFKDLQPGDVESTCADVNDLFEKFNFRPNTKIKDGVKKFVSWYTEYYK